MSFLKNVRDLMTRKALWVLLTGMVFLAGMFLFTQNSKAKKLFASKISPWDFNLIRQPVENAPTAGSTQFVRQAALRSPPMSPFLVRRQAERLEFSNPKQLLEVLGVHEGMKILDFGTGSGQYAYLFAEAMKGSGMVYASDIASKQIQYVEKEIERRGIKNIQAVLTDGAQFDPFYDRIKVDLIFMARTHFYLDNPEEYFTRLKTSLEPKGRFALLGPDRIASRTFSSFFKPDDITNLSGLLTFLRKSSFEKVPFTLFSPEVRKEIALSESGHAPKKVKTLIADDLNRMLSSDILMDAFFDKQGNLDPALGFLPDEKKFAEWAMRFIKDEGPLFEGNPELMKSVHMRYEFHINGILVVNQLRPFLFNGQGLLMAWRKMPSELPIKGLLLKLGYRLEGEYDFVPFEKLLLFSLPQGEEGAKGELRERFVAAESS